MAVTADGGFLTADSGNGRVRKVAPTGMITTTAAPWTSAWLPPGYEQNFWNAA